MSKWGWATRIGGYAAAPFTAGFSIPASQIAASEIEKRQKANDGPGGGKGSSSDDPEAPFLNQLQQSSQSLRQQGDQLSGMGTDTLAPLLKQIAAMMGSDPAALMDATRQERGRVIDQYDTARRAISQFGPRGGGTTSALANSRFEQAESLADITSSAKNDAMGLAGALGTQLAGLGLSAQQLASADIDTIIRAVLAREGLDVQRRGQNMGLVGDIAETAGMLYGIWLGRDKGDAGGGTTGTQGGPTVGRDPRAGATPMAGNSIVSPDKRTATQYWTDFFLGKPQPDYGGVMY